MATTTLHVTGMTCGHCASAVTQELRALDGVTSVEVELRPGAASAVTVAADRPLEPAELAAAVDEAGYALTDAP